MGRFVNDVTEGREKASLAAFDETRTPEQIAGIDAIAGDAWEPYVQATLETACAGAVKENLRYLWSFRVEGWARRFFSQ